MQSVQYWASQSLDNITLVLKQLFSLIRCYNKFIFQVFPLFNDCWNGMKG